MNIEQAREIQSSLNWKAILGEVDKRLNYEIQKLRKCKPEDLSIIQAKIDAYESIARLPGDVIERES